MLFGAVANLSIHQACVHLNQTRPNMFTRIGTPERKMTFLLYDSVKRIIACKIVMQVHVAAGGE